MRTAPFILAVALAASGCKLFSREQSSRLDTGPQKAAQTASVGAGGVSSQDTTQNTRQDNRSVQNDPWPIVAVVMIAALSALGAAWLGDQRLKHWTRKHGYTQEQWEEKRKWQNGDASKGDQ